MGCLSVVIAFFILADAFDQHVWHSREWAEFGLGVGLLLVGFIVSLFED